MRNVGIVISLIASALTIGQMYLAGNKNVWAWKVSLVNQVVWVANIWIYKSWGLLPLTVTITVLSIRNLRKWNAEERTIEQRIARLRKGLT